MNRIDRAALVRIGSLALVWMVFAAAAPAASNFVNFETPQVHPIDLSPDRNTLAVVNTADNSLLLFDVSDGNPRQAARVSVGLDPVSVRFLSNREAWVVNQISDSVSVVDIPTRRVRATLDTLDEPADVVFAGSPSRAFVSCSQANRVLVFDPDALGEAPRTVKIAAEDPRAMAVSPNGRSVYVAIFESGNASTVLAGGFQPLVNLLTPTLPANVVSDPASPYGGVNPPPNAGTAFAPPIADPVGPPPPVALIVKKNGAGRWLDDNAGDWTAFVSGPQARKSHRRRGWDVIDRDVAVIDARSLSVRYIEGLMNANMALGVNPVSGEVTVVGTDAVNEVRFEPRINGAFLRVNLAMAPPGGGRTVVDLNPHLDYSAARLPQTQRNRSIGDPRAVVWNAAGSRAWVAGMGSNNLVVVNAQGGRVGDPGTIEVGQGPTGLALDEGLGRLYVLNRFAATVSVVDTSSGRQIQRVKFFDPTPRAIRKGRKHLYDTHQTSGLGHAACASCHIDARTDRLAWDLGAPDGKLKSSDKANLLVRGEQDLFEDWHPMKGPMMTQTLQDIIGKEPHHWRGDRDGLEEFADAFATLMGDDKALKRGKMRQFERFLATIHFPPNPFRNLDNSLPESLPLTGHVRSGRFGREGKPLPPGNARLGLELFRTRGVLGSNRCVTCHSLPVGAGSPRTPEGESIPSGPDGEAHLALIGNDFSAQLGFKIPQLRSSYDKVGMDYTASKSRSGFGFFHDGSIDTLERFVSAEIFDLRSDQEAAHLVALLLAFSGSDLGTAAGDPAGSPSLDAHAAVGRQVTVSSGLERRGFIDDLVAVARAADVDLVARGLRQGAERGWVYDPAGDAFRPDGAGEPARSLEELLALAAPGSEITLTAVPAGSGERIGFARLRSAEERGRRRRREAGSSACATECPPPAAGERDDGRARRAPGKRENRRRERRE